MRKIIFSLCAWSLLFAGGLLAQNATQPAQEPTGPSQQTQNPPQTQAQPQSQSEQQPAETNEQPKKLKKLSGKLVDLPCMEKGLSSMEGGGPSSPGPATTAQPPKGNSFAGSSSPAQTAGQGQPGAQGQNPAGQAQPPGAQAPTAPGENPYPGQQGPAASGPTPAEKQAQQCPATASTTAFGLVLGDGKFVKLDDQGNSKASEAIKTTTLKEGKAPKAKVKGTVEGDMVKVADIQVKGQRSSGSQNRQGQASPGK
jgi:hypothetical protein